MASQELKILMDIVMELKELSEKLNEEGRRRVDESTTEYEMQRAHQLLGRSYGCIDAMNAVQGRIIKISQAERAFDVAT